VKEIRQGDVLLSPVAALPEGKVKKPIQPEKGTRFVLAHGEVTGHAHAIYEFDQDKALERQLAEQANEIAEAAIARAMAQRSVQLWDVDGEWYLEVRKPSEMRHEEHTAPKIPEGFYYAPIQVQHTVGNMPKRVTD
jgi:hypothetical protein